MSRTVSLTESTSALMLTQLFLSYNQQQRLDFIHQIILNHSSDIDNLISYVNNKEAYYHKDIKIKIGDIISVSTEFSWSTSIELQWYRENGKVKNNRILTTVTGFSVLSNNNAIVMLQTKSGIIKREISSSYIKKIDLY